MARADVVLLHAPAVYDFREQSILFGPVSDLVPSTPIFETYPLGLSTIGEYLERFGYRVRTANIAYRMLISDKFDPEAFIRKLRPKIFGIDLHWMPHCHGAIELARICKKVHPDIPVIFGGLSSTYFHEELLEYDCIDFVLRGDSTEEPFRILMDTLSAHGAHAHHGMLANVPNLTWKDRAGSVVVNDLSWVPNDFNLPALDFSYNMKSVIRYRDLFGSVPFKQWLGYPMCASLTCRGCTHNCVTCGGSAETFRKHFGRSRVAFRDPELLVRDIAHAQKYIPGPIFVLNDFLQAGMDYAREFLEGLGKIGLDSPVGFEFFGPPKEELYDLMAANLKDWSVEISVESHDDVVRQAFGKSHYTMADIEDTIELALAKGASRFDLYFMMGIPTQTAQSAVDTAHYCRGLYDRMNNDPRLLTFTSPMAPFLDPGSMAFDNPEKYGYTLRAKTVEEHRQLMLQPSWKHIMNYESASMSRDEMVQATYEAGLVMNRVKADAGVIDATTAAQTEARIHEAVHAMDRIDAIMEMPEPARASQLHQFSDDMKALSESTVCEKSELDWPVTATLGNVGAVVGLWAREEFGNIFAPWARPSTSSIHKQYRREQLQEARSNV